MVFGIAWEVSSVFLVDSITYFNLSFSPQLSILSDLFTIFPSVKELPSYYRQKIEATWLIFTNLLGSDITFKHISICSVLPHPLLFWWQKP